MISNRWLEIRSLKIHGGAWILASTLTLCAWGVAGALPAATDAGSAPPSSMDNSDNPLLVESSLPYHLPPFDRIKSEHFSPAFERGMEEGLKDAEAIAQNPEKASFENTLVALERAGQLLGRVSRIFFSLVGANTNPILQKIEKEVAPNLAAYRDTIHLNPTLFLRIETVYTQRGQLGLSPEDERLVERTFVEFVRAGAKLSDSDKTRLKALNAELASLQTTFSQNVLKESNASAVLIETRDELKGLPEDVLATAAEAAKEAKEEGKFLLRIVNTSNQPAEDSLENRALRERLQQVSVSRGSRGGEFDNRATVAKLAGLRAERAALLGYPSHAAYILEDQTAHTVDAVNKILAQLAPPAVANARREASDVQAIIDREGGGFRLAAWDWAFYAEKVRRERYQFDESALRPYFELDRVLQDGVFYAANRLYGVSFVERKDLPVYQADVRVFEVFDANGKPLALFLGDYYARPSKRGGAWMNAYVEQSRLFGNKPVVANHLNISKPSAGQPTLLTYTEVKTMFHEFGHALHGMFSAVTYPRFSGTSVPRDFVEYPSQVNEMWAVWPEVLSHYAKHYQTGEAMPPALLEKMLATLKFNQGFLTTEYLAAALLDQAWHQLKPDEIPADVMAFEAAALKKAGVGLPEIPPRYRSTYFSHVFSGGYSAGYYSYIWAEVLDADSVDWFKAHGGLKRENGDHFRQTLLSRGGTADAMVLFKNFFGSDPDIEPLLKRRGLDGK